MVKLEYDENVAIVLKKYPFAYRCEDRHGYYIVDGVVVGERPVLGQGKSAVKAWKNAATLIKKTKKKRGRPPGPKPLKKKRVV